MKNEQSQVTWLHVIVSWIGTLFLYLVGKTSFLTVWDNPIHLGQRRKKESFIYAFWHNMQVYMAYAHRHEAINVMVSRSKDGEYIAQVMKKVGLNPIRGSSSRGGDQALRELIEVLEKGGQAAFTPDGPRGPLYQVQGGVVFAAKTARVPIVPMALISSHQIEFASWDHFILPYPFGKAVLVRGRPFRIAPHMDEAEAKELVRTALNQVRENALHHEFLRKSWFSCFVGRLGFLLYNVFLLLLLPLLIPVLFIRYGKRSFYGMAERLGKGVSDESSGEERLWLHAASVGEWRALKPLYEELKQASELNIIITVSTPEAKKMIRQELPACSVSLLPLDLPWIMSSFVRKMNPAAVIVLETEIWPNFFQALKKRSVPLFLVNARLSEKSVVWWSYGKWVLSFVLKAVSHFFVRSEEDGQRFRQLETPANRISVGGNLKYDSIQVVGRSERQKEREATFGPRKGTIFVAGSTWEGEEKILLEVFQEMNSSLGLILAPRHLHRLASVQKLLKPYSRAWTLWSEVKKQKSWTTDLMLVDTLGDLPQLYRTADIAFVGGSLSRHGGQNPLEPASACLPVLFGPHMENFLMEASLLKSGGAAVTINTKEDLKAQIIDFLTHTDSWQAKGEAAGAFIRSQQGVSRRITKNLLEQLGMEKEPMYV